MVKKNNSQDDLNNTANNVERRLREGRPLPSGMSSKTASSFMNMKSTQRDSALRKFFAETSTGRPLSSEGAAKLKTTQDDIVRQKSLEYARDQYNRGKRSGQ